MIAPRIPASILPPPITSPADRTPEEAERDAEEQRAFLSLFSTSLAPAMPAMPSEAALQSEGNSARSS